MGDITCIISSSGNNQRVQPKIELGSTLLKSVSRSFYLSIRLLPSLMREPVSIAYLLARASDTLADTEKVPADLRYSCLSLFHGSLKDEKKRDEMLELISSKFVEYQDNPREKILLDNLVSVFEWYDSIHEWAWNDIAAALKPIIEGQLWDVKYFGIDKNTEIKTEEDLDLYCYQVAGSVGEFWGNVGQNAYKRFSELSNEKLQSKGASYGKGLQLINILRDLPEDLEQGRCYLPDLEVDDKEKLVQQTKKYRIKARKNLDQGLLYASSLRQKRTKIATVLPIFIGLETLDLMEDASWEDWQAGIKISRKQLRKCVKQAIFY